MRFSLVDNILIPEPLVEKQENTPLKPISYYENPSSPKINPSYSFSRELQRILYGKQLLLDELPIANDQIHEHYLNGYLQYRKGVMKSQNGTFCNRCGNSDKERFAEFSCARCHEACTYCRKCITMGRVSECTPLLSWTGSNPIEPIPERPLAWEGTLSEGQKRASEALIKAVNANGQILVWAVCGAGKTEILFEGIEVALLAGKRVCIATPRTDVVIELAPRLKKAFPEIDVIALYGGSEDREKTSPLVIATTHQLLRFYKAFDVMITDEVDAFPYSVEPMLQYAADQAKKDDSATIFLTATPSTKWQREISLGKRNAVTIPARFHRHPLPVPVFVWCGNWQKSISKQRLPQNVVRWVNDHLESQKQGFLFVPRIASLDKIVSILRKRDERIDGVHAEDPDRKEKVAAFRRGEIPILVTTTILERGVTVPNIDVAVLGAEDTIFTESALVQISGRVGRSAQHPTGEVLFFHYGRTREMIKAKRHIEAMNKEGLEKGYLDKK